MGKELIPILGLVTFLLLLGTGTMGFALSRQKSPGKFKAHKTLAILTITVATIHLLFIILFH